MSNFLRTGQAFINRTFKEKVSTGAFYIRDGVSSDVILMTKTQSPAGPAAAGSAQAQIAADRFDFICDARDLVIRGVIVTPQANDAILCEGERYAVADEGRDSCWRQSGAIPGRIRIHTVRAQ